MRVAFLGNNGNNAYRLCKWIRAEGVDAELYLLTNTGTRSLPEQVDRGLATDGYPSWIHPREPGTFKPEKHRRDFEEVERRFDIVVTSAQTGLALASHFECIPVVHLSLGYEVTTLPLLRFDRSKDLRRRSRAARRGLKAATVVVCGFRPSMATVIRLDLRDKLRVFGFPEDVAGNVDRVEGELLEALNRKYAGFARVFFWFSRLFFIDKKAATYKGPEHFAEAARRLILDDGANVRLVVGTHGADAEPFQELIGDLGLEPHVDWVPHMPYWRLLTHLSVSNAIAFDEIDRGKGELSGLAREALSVGGVVIKTIDRELIDLCFGPGCPVIDAVDANSCYEAMRLVTGLDEKAFAALKTSCLEWARDRLHFKRNVGAFLDVLREVLYLDGVERRR